MFHGVFYLISLFDCYFVCLFVCADGCDLSRGILIRDDQNAAHGTHAALEENMFGTRQPEWFQYYILTNIIIIGLHRTPCVKFIGREHF